METGKHSILFIFLLGLAGCHWGTPNDHHRPPRHGNISIDGFMADFDDVAIVFNSFGTGGRDLYLLRLNDMSLKRIAETPEYETDPAFSPDGQSVAYAGGLPGDRADHIYTIRIDGTEKKQLTDADANDTEPDFSPDGKLIAFTREKTYNRGGYATNWDGYGVICVVNSDGTSFRQLTSNDELAHSPQFSPDGKHIFYSVDSGMYSVSVAGDAVPIRIGPGRLDYSLAADGQTIVFADVVDGEYRSDLELFVSRLDGTEKIQLTDSEHGSYRPVFVTNNQIYFLVVEMSTASIWSVTREGEDLRRVTNRQFFDEARENASIK